MRMTRTAAVAPAVALTLISLSASGAIGAELFGPAPLRFPTGQEPVSIAAGDFNLDGAQDFAFVSRTDNSISILLGDGFGGFTRTVDLPPVVQFGNVVDIAVGDFNADGKPDLATANYSLRAVTIFLGDGFGGFTRTTDLVLYGFAAVVSVAVGEFNGDGRQDLAVVNPNADSVIILLGDGQGGFTQAPDLQVGARPGLVVTADFNSDGAQDLATTGSFYPNSTLTVLLGDGLGGFTRMPDLQLGMGGSSSFAVGQFNADGVLDLAVPNFYGGSVSVFLGDGLGGFTRTVDLSLGGNPFLVSAGDFNADGTQDLAVANYIYDPVGRVDVLLGDGLGGFTYAAQFPVGSQPSSFAAGDFDGDGAEDLAVPNRLDSTVSVLLGGGLQGFTPTPNSFAGSFSASSVAVGDFNTDGAEDLATAGGESGVVTALVGDGRGSFTHKFLLSTGSNPSAVTLGDFNADGVTDLAATNISSNTVGVLLGDGLGGFTLSGGVSVGQEPTAVAAGAFSAYLDGAQDLAVANRRDNTLSVLLGDGAGGFTRASDHFVGRTPAFVTVGSFDSNGAPDLAVANSDDDTVSVLLGNGRGGFTRTVDLPVGRTPSCVAVGEFNADGAQDLAVANADDDTVSVLLGDGQGGFTRTADLQAGASPQSVAVSDFNDDAIQDLAIVNSDDNTVTVLLGDGLGSFTRTVDLHLPGGVSPASVAVGDFNADGEPDLAVANLHGVVRLLFNQLHARADLNGSNRVDGFDVAAVSRLAGCGAGDPCYRRNADVNLDGIVDGNDLAVIASRFGGFIKPGSALVAALRFSSPRPTPGTVTIQKKSSAGDLLTLDVIVNDTVNPVGAADFAVTYDAQVLKFAGFGPGSYLGGSDVVQVARADESNPGAVTVTVDRVPSRNTIGSGAEVLLSLSFTAKSLGQTTLGFARFQKPGPALLDASGQEVTGVSFVGGAIVDVSAPAGGSGGKAAVSPATLDFGGVAVGASGRKKVRISNLGSGSLALTSVTSSVADFDTFFTEPFEIPAHGFVELDVVFTPASAGVQSGEIVIETDDSSPLRQRIHLPLTAVGS